MSIVIAFLISMVTGYFILRIIRPSALRGVDVFLIPGIGLGVSAQIVFYSLLIFNQLVPFWIIAAHLICLTGVFVYSRAVRQQTIEIRLSKQDGCVVLLLLLALVIGSIVGLNKPYGDWDAWGFWNYHANFIFRAGTRWLDVFQFSTWWAHHPWMLPCMVLWGWGLNGAESVLVPIAISLIFCLSCLGLLVCSLKERGWFGWALVAGLFLLSLPIFMAHATSQYADIVLAYFILAISILIVELFKNPSTDKALMLGLFLGLAACTKDNGIVAVIIFGCLLLSSLRRNKAWIKHGRALIYGFMSILASVLLMKGIESFNTGNHGYDVSWASLFDWHRWVLIGKFTWQMVMDSSWGLLWSLSFLVLFIFRRQIKEEEGLGLILRFVGIYIISYLFMYAGTVLELKWLLSVSYYRLVFLIAPTLVWVMFSALGRANK